MTCDKCGKELEVIKTDTGGAFLPCNCHNTAKLIACALRENRISAFQEAWLSMPTQDNEGYVPDRGGFKCGWNAAFFHYNVLKMAKALEIAIEAIHYFKNQTPYCEKNISASRCYCKNCIHTIAIEQINDMCR